MAYRKVDGVMTDMMTRALPRGSVQQPDRNVFAGFFYNRCPMVSPRSNNELAVERGIHISRKGNIIRLTVGNKADIGSRGATYWPESAHKVGQSSR